MEHNPVNPSNVSGGPTPGTTPPANSAQPVAYDAQGRPLYLHPAAVQAAVQQQSAPQPSAPQTVYLARPLEPREADIPEHIRQRHEESKRRYPRLNLSEGEYIINSVKRHVIGLIGIWAIAFMLIAALAAVLAGGLAGGSSSSLALVTAGLAVVSIFIVIGAMVASYVYDNNRFYLTNESVIQEIQTSPFNRNEQTVSLSNIEDASYRKDGVLAHMFNFGTIRLSTEGDETTYRFSYVSDPKQHIAVLNNAVEAFKNGRPVEPSNDDQAS